MLKRLLEKSACLVFSGPNIFQNPKFRRTRCRAQCSIYRRAYESYLRRISDFDRPGDQWRLREIQ